MRNRKSRWCQATSAPAAPTAGRLRLIHPSTGAARGSPTAAARASPANQQRADSEAPSTRETVRAVLKCRGVDLAPLDQGVVEQQLHGQVHELDHAEGERADPELGWRQRPAEDHQRGEGEAGDGRRSPAPSRAATGPRARAPRRSPGPSARALPRGTWPHRAVVECGARPRGIRHAARGVERAMAATAAPPPRAASSAP